MRPPVVRLRGLGKDHACGASTLTVLDGVDLDVRHGEYVAIVGASGSGKSTLMGVLGCLDRPTRGAYELDGRPVARLADDELAALRNRCLGFVFQSFHLVPDLSVAENVELPLLYARVPRVARRERSRTLLDRVGLGARIGHRPHALSGGERQRVAIARALANDPALVLMDEPTGSLDRRTGAGILDLFDAVHAGGATLVTVTHDLAAAARAPRVVELRDGRVVRDECRGEGAS